MKNLYYKGLNSFTLRQISSKINTTVFSMTVICLMLFITICVLSSALSLKNSMTANIASLAPADIQLTKRMNMDESWTYDGYSETQIKNSTLNLEETLEKLGMNINSYLSEKIEYYIYQDDNLTLADTLGSKLEQIQNQYTSIISFNTKEDIMKISDYNKIAEFYTPKYEQCQEGFIEMSSNHINSGVIIVSDEIVDETKTAYSSIIGNYEGDKKEKEDRNR